MGKFFQQKIATENCREKHDGIYFSGVQFSVQPVVLSIQGLLIVFCSHGTQIESSLKFVIASKLFFF